MYLGRLIVTLNENDREILKRARKRWELEIEASGNVPIDEDSEDVSADLKARLADIKTAVLALNRKAIRDAVAPADVACVGLNRSEELGPELNDVLDKARKNVKQKLTGSGNVKRNGNNSRKGAGGSGR